jgi:hypothetical protein
MITDDLDDELELDPNEWSPDWVTLTPNRMRSLVSTDSFESTKRLVDDVSAILKFRLSKYNISTLFLSNYNFLLTDSELLHGDYKRKKKQSKHPYGGYSY